MNFDPRASRYVHSGRSRDDAPLFPKLLAPDVRALIAKGDDETLRELVD
ncbi:MAG TPA: hypothetical protein VGE52_14195 [Pirellulales bacterium]